jgi:hypothetical protein
LNKLFGFKGETRYTYNELGLVQQICKRSPTFEEVKTFAYNEHRDKQTERTTYARSEDRSFPVGVTYSIDENGNFFRSDPTAEVPLQPELPPNYEVQYTYEYDEHGNWIEQRASSEFGPNLRIRRQLTYY